MSTSVSAYFDTHCHLDCQAFDADRSATLERAFLRGVTDIVVPAVGASTWEPILGLAQATSGARCHAALGIHPVALPDMPLARDEACLHALSALLPGSGSVAVGECGLDATLDLTRAPWERQVYVLVAQLAMARAQALPVILHARGHEAYRRLLEILQRVPLPAAGGVIHSYGGGAASLPAFAALGLYFGFAGPATYPNARKVRASISGVPRARLLAETDAPDQTPEPHRPGRSEPAYVADVVEGLAGAVGESVEAMAARTSRNARALFAMG